MFIWPVPDLGTSLYAVAYDNGQYGPEPNNKMIISYIHTMKTNTWMMFHK